MTTIHEQIARATERLARLKARELLKQQRASAKAKEASRRADAHRKIGLGGLIIAAEADHLDPAEIVGVLLMHLKERDTVSQGSPSTLAYHARELGINQLEHRERMRITARKR